MNLKETENLLNILEILKLLIFLTKGETIMNYEVKFYDLSDTVRDSKRFLVFHEPNLIKIVREYMDEKGYHYAEYRKLGTKKWHSVLNFK